MLRVLNCLLFLVFSNHAAEACAYGPLTYYGVTKENSGLQDRDSYYFRGKIKSFSPVWQEIESENFRIISHYDVKIELLENNENIGAVYDVIIAKGTKGDRPGGCGEKLEVNKVANFGVKRISDGKLSLILRLGGSWY